MNDEPPGVAKLELIRAFLRLNGTQDRIDSGAFFSRLAFFGSPFIAELGAQGIRGTVNDVANAFSAAYASKRDLWQAEYERHVNWEFSEAELEEIIAFLESAVGCHFLEGRWRMDAYVSTNMEGEFEEVVAEAKQRMAASSRLT